MGENSRAKFLKITKRKRGIKLDYHDISEHMLETFSNDTTMRRYDIDVSRYETKAKVTTKDLRKKRKYIKKNVKDTRVVFDNTSVTVSRAILIRTIKKTKKGYGIDRKKLRNEIKTLIPSVRPYRVTVKTRAGKKTLSNYGISYPVDTKRTASSVMEAIKSKTYEAKGYPGDTPYTNTRVEVNLKAQEVYFIKDGKTRLTSSCVTGTAGHRTPTGIYRIAYKGRNVTLKDRNDDGSKYESFVRYWMPFNLGIGLHDADWRGSFGGSIYLSNGSHGCVNMPIPKAEELFGLVQAGTLVYVY